MNRRGVGVIVVRGDDILFGLRRGAHGAGTWSFPGGHLHDGEAAEACALRELYEEAGLEAVSPRVVAETEDHFPGDLRYRTLFVQVDWAGGEPKLREPDASARWGWFGWDDPPKPLFLSVANLRATGFRPLTRSERAQRSDLSVPETGTQLTTTASGFVEAIHIAATAGAPTRPLEVVRASPGIGLEGDRYAAGQGHYSHDHRVSRDLTLIEAEVIEVLARDHGIALASGETRRNITTRGIRLDDLLGRRFRVGEVLCEGTRLCEPCQYLADLTGKPLLRPLVHRGGLRADIVRGGYIRHGDRIQVVDEEAIAAAAARDGQSGLR